MKYYINAVTKFIYVILDDGMAFSWIRKKGVTGWHHSSLCTELIKVLTNIGPLCREDLKFYCQSVNITFPDEIKIEDNDDWDNVPV